MTSEKTAAVGIREVYEWAEAIAYSLAAVVILFTFVFRIVGVDGQSMEKTLQDGNRLIITSIGYTPKQGDIIVFPVNPKVETHPLIKRVIAVGGQTVDVDYKTNTVTVDGKVLDESSYFNGKMNPPLITDPISFPVKVPAGKVFVMGDNRNFSYDGRSASIGFIDDRDILGHVVFRIYPFGGFGRVG